MRLLTTIRNWGVSSLLTYFLFEMIWSITNHTWPFHDEWLVCFFDLLYCSVFVLTSMAMCGALSLIKFFRRMDFWSQTCLCVVTLMANLMLAFEFEWMYNNMFKTDDISLMQSSLYVFCIVSTLFTLVHHMVRYFRIVLQQKENLAELQKKVLKAQLDPHFVFNSLSTLTELIHESPAAAEKYTLQFSRIYRHLLSTLDRSTVAIGDSLKLVRDYVVMQTYRVDGDIELKVDLPERIMSKHLFPLSLQTLVENAIKHNVIRKGDKLIISIIATNDEYITVRNQKIERNYHCQSTGIGLQTLCERYHLEHLPEPIVTETDDYYEVKIRIIDNWI